MNQHQERLQALRNLMKQHNLDVYLVPTGDPHMSEYLAPHFMTRAWLTGFSGSAGSAIVTADEAVLYTDGRYFVQAEKELEDTGFKLMKQNTPGYPSLLDFVKSKLQKGMVLGYNGLCVSQGYADVLAKTAKAVGASSDGTHTLVESLWMDQPALPSGAIWRLDRQYAGEAMTSKVRRLRDWLSTSNLDCLLLSSLDDIAWLYNLRGDDVAHTPVFLSYTLVSQERAVLYIDKTKIDPDLTRYLTAHGVTLADYADVFADLASLGNSKIALNASETNQRLYSSIAPSTTIKDCANWTKLEKARKNETEIANERLAFIKDGVALTTFIHWLKHHPDLTTVSEMDTVEKLKELRRLGEHFVDESFGTIAAYGANAAMMHYSPDITNSAKLAPQDFLLMDSGGHYLEGSTDITRTISLGTLSDEAKRYYTFTLKSHIALSTAVFLEGTTGYYLDALARQPLWQERMDYKCGTGHGIGYCLCVHEGPQRIANSSACLEPLELGMLVSNEPGVYKAGEIGIRLENILAVVPDTKTNDGTFLRFEDLTLVPFDRNAVEISLLTDAELQWLNDYQEHVYAMLAPKLAPDVATWLHAETLPLAR